MGENEQGGMLRVVVVIGLIAIIAAVVIFAVTGLKGTSTAQREAAVSNVTRAQMNSRNLLLNSKTLGWGYGNNNYVNVTTENYDSTMKMWHLTSPQSNLQYVGVYWYQPGNTSYQLVKGDQWAFSFDIKGTGVYHIVGSENSTGYKGPTGDVSTGWTRVSATGTATNTNAILVYFDTHTKPLDVYIKAPKLELGTVATDYSE